jgi:hypothetical protein
LPSFSRMALLNIGFSVNSFYLLVLCICCPAFWSLMTKVSC